MQHSPHKVRLARARRPHAYQFNAIDVALAARLVLIVDDDLGMLRAIERDLLLAGYATIVASDGLQGVDMALSHDPALIVMNWLMPRMDGLEAIMELRKAGFTAPIIMDSAYDSRVHRDRALEKGANAYVRRPRASEELVAQVRLLIG